MSEREGFDYTINITVLEEKFICYIKTVETGEIFEFSEKKLITLAQKISRILFVHACLERGLFGMEEKFTRERIRTFIREKCREDCFCVPDYACRPACIGVFITWEGEGDDVPQAQQSNAPENDPDKTPTRGGVFTW